MNNHALAEDYFARVRPLLGKGLSEHAVLVDDARRTLLVVEMLASCMLQHVVVTQPETLMHLVEHLQWKQPFQPLRAAAPTVDARILTRAPGHGEPPSLEWNAQRREVVMVVDPADTFAWMDLSYTVARTIRDALLRRTPWPHGRAWHGNPAWPFSPRPTPVATSSVDFSSLRGRHLVVIGCGSLGSEAIRALTGHGARWTLIDESRVTVFNLARQWFGADEVGVPKVEALERRLASERVRSWKARVEAEELGALEALLRGDPPDVVLLATGTHHHGMIGELLWRLRIPHVAACCYPQARYFEVSVVSPALGTPCLHCFRGHLYRGTPEPAPMDNEVANFLYQPMDEARRNQAYRDLVAEPATRIETARAAEVLARCALELCSPQPSTWFQRVIDEGTTCLLGGNVARQLPDGSHAYGIREPGQVIRLGLDDVVGSAESVECHVCGRRMDVTLREDLPAVADDADAALL
ncbi:MAG: ThiF family adenylyltransferase [Myxococcota bacterium]